MSALLFVVLAGTLFAGSAFLPGAFLRREGGRPRPEDFVLGYAATALACFFSLVLLGTMLPGALLAVAASVAATVRAVRRGEWRFRRDDFGPAFFVKLSFVGLLAAVYGSILLGQEDRFFPPPVFDFPKHVSAVASLAEATGWPAPNPWLPDCDFAYNLLFYAPLGLLARLSRPAACSPLVAVTLLFVAWHGLGVLESVLARLGVAGNRRAVGLLFATFVCGFTPLLLSLDAPLGCLVEGCASGRHYDDPLTVFLPQHLFAVLCVVCGWLSAVGEGPPATRLTEQTVLATAASLASYLVAPLAGLFFAGALAVQALAAQRRGLRGFTVGQASCLPAARQARCLPHGLALLVHVAATFPFLLQARAWEGGVGLFQAASKAPWLPTATFLTAAPVLTFAVAGLGYRRASQRTAADWSFPALALAATVLFLFVSPPGDLRAKWGVLAWFLLVPLAGRGFLRVERLARYTLGPRATLVAGAVLGYLCLNGLTLTGHYLCGAYLLRPGTERALVRLLRSLPPGAPVWIEEPDQSLAAEAGRVVWMDFGTMRPGAYLPLGQRERRRAVFPGAPTSFAGKLDRLKQVQQTGSVAVLPLVPWKNLLGLLRPPVLVETPWHVAVDLRRPLPDNVVRRLTSLGTVRGLAVIDGRSLTWAGSSAVRPGVVVASAPPRISASDLVDLSLTAPVKLAPGWYRVTAQVSGEVDGVGYGPGQVSLVGLTKLIAVPAGRYPPGTRFEDYFSIGPAGYAGLLGFGLGGWTAGKGTLELEGLWIERLPVSADGEVGS